MLSVLIATYNWNVVSLIENLHQQLEKAAIPFEIICFDDASKSELNSENERVNALSNTTFKALKKNVGRSAIRNLLAQEAKYDWLLFLDADTLPTSNEFIQNYLNEIHQKKVQVILGGIAYQQDKDSNRIRWKLGKKGEEQPAETRNQNPYNYFFTANFLIEKPIFSQLKFDESLTEYGYEDLLFAKELESKSIPVKHIDNAVFHLGIDTNEQFLVKTKKGLENLIHLIEQKKISEKDTKISNLFFQLKSVGLSAVLGKFTSFFEAKAVGKSSLFYYQLFRLAYLHKIVKNS